MRSALRGFIDILCLPLFVLSFVTPWNFVPLTLNLLELIFVPKGKFVRERGNVNLRNVTLPNMVEDSLVWYLIVMSGLCCLIDLVLIPPLVFALLSGTRTLSLLEDLGYPLCTRSPSNHADIATVAEAAHTARTATPPVANIDETTGYNYGYRQAVLRNAGMAAVDLLFVPLLLILLLTRYRYTRDLSTSSGQRWGLEQYGIILRQGLLLLLDTLTLPLVVIVMVTYVRYAPLRTAFSQDQMKVEATADANGSRKLNSVPSQVHTTAVFQIGLLLLDILFLPSFLLVLLSWYRWRYVRGTMALPHFHEHPLNFHLALFLNTFVILFDVVLVAPDCLFIAFSMYKLPALVCLLKPEPSTSSSERGDATAAIDPMPVVHDPDDFSMGPRAGILSLCVEQIIDIPFLLIGAVVFGSLWRSLSMHKELQTAEGKKEWRSVVITQFQHLLQDLLVFPLFVILVGTVYRFPSVFFQLLSRWSAPLGDKPLFETESLFMEAPEFGEVKLFFKLLTSPAENDVEGKDVKGNIKDVKHLRMRVEGKEFWEQISITLGETVKNVGRGLLPLKLTDKEVSYKELNNNISGDLQNIEVPLTFTTGAKKSTLLKKVRQLDQRAELLLQFECTASVEGARSQPRVLLCCPLLVSSLVEGLEGKGMVALQPARLASEEYGQKLFELRPSRKDHKGIVDSFSIIVLLEFAQLCVDMWYLFLFSFCLLLPHRAFAVILCLVEPKARWPGRVCGKVRRMLQNLEDERVAYLAELAPIANEYAKRGISYYKFREEIQNMEKGMKLHHKIRKGVSKVLQSTEGLNKVHSEVEQLFTVKDSYMVSSTIFALQKSKYSFIRTSFFCHDPRTSEVGNGHENSFE
jgi:hypothetical protein